MDKGKTIASEVNERFSVREQRMLTDNSIERVINTSVTLVTKMGVNRRLTEAEREMQDINLQDWEELKELTVKLWNLARNDVFIAHNRPLTKMKKEVG